MKIIITTLDGSTIIYNSFLEYCIHVQTNVVFHSYDDIPSYKSDLVEEWRYKGILHRETGPAYIKYDKYDYDNHFVLSSPRRIFFKEYSLGDVRYKEDEYYLELENVDKMDLALQLLDEREWVRERAKSKQKDIKDEK